MIVVRDGGILSVVGTAHHEGLILVEEGGQIDLASGTFDLYGGIVMLKSNAPNGQNNDEDDGTDLALSGNIYLSYSSAALKNLEPLETGNSGGINAASWQEIY